jgi:hypothetical protein
LIQIPLLLGSGDTSSPLPSLSLLCHALFFIYNFFFV